MAKKVPAQRLDRLQNHRHHVHNDQHRQRGMEVPGNA